MPPWLLCDMQEDVREARHVLEPLHRHGVALDYHVPVVNAILTTEDLAQAEARQEEKGHEAARVAVEMINLLDRIG